MTYNEFIKNILNTRGRFNCGEEYHERHHIIPKCMGGSNDEENLIDLYAKEHYEAHKLLALENPHNKRIIYAWWNMSQCSGSSKKRKISTGEEYENLRALRSKMLSEDMCGREFSEETIEKMKHSQKKRYANGNKGTFYMHKHTEEAKEKIREKRIGKKLTEEHKSKISNGILSSDKYREYIEHCGKPVICDGIIFNSVTSCARHYGLNDTTLHGYLSGSKKMPKKWLKLGLMYYYEN